ncbi:MAG: acetyl-CoA hydrolase/transferase C-terminal domain-containing protein [Pseudomonadota bacterium]
MSQVFDSADALAEAVIESVGANIVLGLPIGIGKPVHIVDALFRRAAIDPSISLQIFTGLTLEPPRGGSELEERFLAPLVERLYSEWPTPAYANAVRDLQLPPNVSVREFYLRPGAYLGNPLVQQSYTSVNYSQVARELERLGVNVVAQLVATDSESPRRYSLSSNPEVTLDLLPYLNERRRLGEPVAVVAQVNRNLPYMSGDAELDDAEIDLLLDDKTLDFPLFTLPNRRVSPADYATAMHVASLVKDGGTLQLGIGSLSDAVAHCLKLRQDSPEIFAQTLERLPGGSRSPGRLELPVETGTFEEGLFASSELLSDALFALYESGVIRRAADADDEALIHAGFFIGSSRLYAALRSLDDAGRKAIRMTSISEVNTLFGDETRKRRQRRDARFVNETMMVTLLGAAVSDALDDGRVVSGVGGQFDFVSMAHALDGAYSILMCRARRQSGSKLSSNIRWSYPHVTVPRHHRDVYVSEYGVAATRGKTDQEVIAAMLGIADSAFQPELLEQAARAGKIGRDYAIPAASLDNTPELLHEVFEHDELRAHFPPYPLDTELTPTERRLADSLEWLKARSGGRRSLAKLVLKAVARRPEDDTAEALARMGLDRPTGLGQRLYRRLVNLGLLETKQ